MTRVLLTGGSGFIAAHILDLLLKQGHSVVTTVRSHDKADRIKQAHPDVNKSQLDFAIVQDIAQPGAFNDAVKSEPPFEAVIHTASPFHYDTTNVQEHVIKPAVEGTSGILKSIKAFAPSVKRVVVTSSYAAIGNPAKGNWPEHTYSEQDWAPLTLEDAIKTPSNGYRVSKTLAEKAAWAFVEQEKPNFELVTINPPMVFGPIIHSWDTLNTSNQAFEAFVKGNHKGSQIPDQVGRFWVDVRDVALAHVRAVEVPEASGKRFFVTKGAYTNRQVVDILRANFPEYRTVLPDEDAKGGDAPAEGVAKTDTSRAQKILGIKFTDLETTLTDLVKSLQALRSL